MKKASMGDLEKLMIDALAEKEGCAGVKSIGIYPLAEPGLPNWKASVINFGDADRPFCERELPQIVKKLQAEYELADDDT